MCKLKCGPARFVRECLLCLRNNSPDFVCMHAYMRACVRACVRVCVLVCVCDCMCACLCVALLVALQHDACDALASRLEPDYDKPFNNGSSV